VSQSESGPQPAARSVAGVAVESDRVFLAQRIAGGNIGGKWEFPGGKIEPGESPAAALIREFHEELGVTVTVGDQIGECMFHSGAREFVVTAYKVTFAGQPRIRREHVSLKWFPSDLLPKLDLPESDMGLVPSVLEFIRKSRSADGV